MPTSKKSLLDVLLQETQAYYLSDLRKPQFYPQMRKTVAGMQDDAYSLREWNDAVNYIFPGGLPSADASAAKAFLLKRLDAEGE